MAGKRKSSWGKWIAMLVLAGAVAGGVAWFNNRPKDDGPEYKTAPVTRGDITQMVTANGQLNPVKNVQVGSQISGIINEIKVDFNSRVKEGEVIAQIDPSTYQRNVEQADAELANAKAALELAEVEAKRAEQLSQSQLIPAADADRARAELNQAKAVVRMREAALSRAKVDFERTTIVAPISGIVISRNVEPGQTVAASFNTPTLFLIANDLAKMQIEAMVSEADVGGVEEGQKVNFNVEAFLGRQFQGTVKQVRFNPTTNQNVVTYVTVIDVDNADLKLRPGMTANASVIIGERPNVLKVPNAALRFRPPPEAVVTGQTNPPPVVPGDTNQMVRLAGGDGPPGASGERPNRDEMRRRFENMSPEEREAFRARRGERGGGGGPGQRPQRSSDGPAIRTVYILAGTNSASREGPVLKAVKVKTGISDSSFTEVLEGLNEGDTVVTGLNIPVTQALAAQQPTSPFGSPFGGRGMRPR